MGERSVIVVGGGIAGVAAAYSLRRAGFNVTIIECQNRLGGRVFSHTMGPHHVELGAQDIVGYYRNTLRLIHETGLKTSLLPIRHTIAIVRRGKPQRLISARALLGSGIISQPAKLRLLSMIIGTVRYWRDLDIQRIWLAEHLDTTSMREMYQGKYGDDLVEGLIAPFLEAMMHCSPDEATRALLPILIKTESSSRNIYRLDGGMYKLIECLSADVRVFLDSSVTRITKNSDEKYSVFVLNHPEPYQADGVVCAVPAHAVLSILDNPPPEETDFFSTVEYSKTVVGTYFLDRKIPSVGSLILASAHESSELGMLSVRSSLDHDRNSLDGDILQLFSSGRGSREFVEFSDDILHERLARAAQAIGVEFDPNAMVRMRRLDLWPTALPKFKVGYLKNLRRFHDYLSLDTYRSQRRGLAFAGDYLYGPFLEGAVTSGLHAAETLRSLLR